MRLHASILILSLSICNWLFVLGKSPLSASSSAVHSHIAYLVKTCLPIVLGISLSLSIPSPFPDHSTSEALLLPSAAHASPSPTSSPPSLDVNAGITLENAKEVYRRLLDSHDKPRITSFHKGLLEYVVGQVSTMYHDPTGGLHQIDDSKLKEIRQKMKGKKFEVIFESKEGIEREIEAVVSSLQDPYSRYISPSADLLNPMDNTLFPNIGIGVAAYFNPSNSHYRGTEIVAIYADSPAEKAGLKIGDLITEVNGVNLEKMYSKNILFLNQSPEEFNRRVNLILSGSDDYPLQLSISPRKSTKEKDAYRVALVRSSAYLKSPGYRIQYLKDENKNEYCYIRLKSFSHRNSVALAETLQKALTSPHHVKALILDLRNNYGGVIQEALAVIIERTFYMLYLSSFMLCLLRTPRCF